MLQIFQKNVTSQEQLRTCQLTRHPFPKEKKFQFVIENWQLHLQEIINMKTVISTLNTNCSSRLHIII